MNDEYSFCPNLSESQASSFAFETKDIDRLAALAKAIAHPARVQILEILARRTACVCGDIVGEMSLAQSTVSEHLRILKAAGLIMGEVDGPRVCYCINATTLSQFKSLVQAMPCPEATSLPPTCQED
jgi:ArsR family transcriptional regulator, arsenate/arsenite/antimonite-responsive transcriptional repressor